MNSALRWDGIEDEAERNFMSKQFAETNKFYNVPAKRKKTPGKFGIFIDPTKCKGCAECVEACDDLGYHALKMIEKEDTTVPIYQKSIDFFRKLPPTPQEFINERVAVDMMLAEQSMLYVGGAGSCAGCGEATAIRMWLAALGYKYGSENVGIAASTDATPFTAVPIRTILTLCRGAIRCLRTARPSRWACVCAGTSWAGRTSSFG